MIGIVINVTIKILQEEINVIVVITKKILIVNLIILHQLLLMSKLTNKKI